MAIMATTNKLWALVAVAVLAFAIGCSGGDEGDGGTTSGTTTGATTGAMNEPTGPTAEQVVAMLNKNCMPCHGGAEPQEGINLETIEGLMKGGEHGPVVVAGDASGSKIVQALRGTGGAKKMPPAASPQPSEEEIKLVEDWIHAGAKTS
jgi:uncharacterized membrane protein